jgi:hypothetical protein
MPAPPWTWLLCCWCSQRTAPPHSLHWLLCRWCSQRAARQLRPRGLVTRCGHVALAPLPLVLAEGGLGPGSSAAGARRCLPGRTPLRCRSRTARICCVCWPDLLFQMPPSTSLHRINPSMPAQTRSRAGQGCGSARGRRTERSEGRREEVSCSLSVCEDRAVHFSNLALLQTHSTVRFCLE